MSIFIPNFFLAEPVDPVCQEILFSGLDKQLSDSECALCEGSEISVVELTLSLKTMSTNKAPGPDGFTVEFYVKFWDLLGPLLSDVINECFWMAAYVIV